MSEYWSTVDSIYGIYLDASQGFWAARQRHINEQKFTIRQLKRTSPERANLEYLDNLQYLYGEGDPRSPDSVVLYKCSQGEFKTRNEKNGSNYRFMANMCLITIYHYWEDEYRKRIACALGKKKNQIVSDIMGDIKRLRNSVVHNNAFAKDSIEKYKILKWFNKGDEIFIDWNMFKEIMGYINSFVREFQRELVS